jgi:hypothetical protein
MQESPKKTIFDVAAIFATFSIACVTGGGFLPAVIQSIFGDFAKGLFSDYLKKFNSERVSAWFTTDHPDQLNHHLQKILSKAVVRALRHIKILYDEQSVETQDQTKQALGILDDLIKKVPQYFDPSTHYVSDQELDFYLYQPPEESMPLLLKTLNLSPEIEGLSTKFTDFLAATLITQVQLCFAEELKLQTNYEAWVAFQRRLAEESRKLLQELVEGQTTLKDQIQDLTVSRRSLSKEQMKTLQELNEQLKNPHFFELKIADQLDQSILQLRQHLVEIVSVIQQTHQHVLDLQRKADLAQRKLINIESFLKTDWFSRKLVIAYILSGLTLLSFAGYTYYIHSLPFSVTLQIHGQRGQNDILLRNRGSVQLQLGQKIEQADINQKGEVYFKELPARYKYTRVIARLTNTEGEPIQLVDSLIYLSSDSIQFTKAKILGLDLLQGYIRDFRTKMPVSNAIVQIQSIKTLTQPDGFFTLHIPPALQMKFQDVRITKKGYLPYIDEKVPMQSSRHMEVFLTPEH